MGCFIGFWGGGDGIIEAKFGEYMDRVRTVLDVGGMMSVEVAELGGHRVPLLAPPREREHPVWGARDGSTETDIEFWYNYYERRSWEGAAVNIDTGFYGGGKVGYSAFRAVAYAVNVLREFYSTRSGIADNNGALSGAEPAIAWFNNIFGETWSNKRVLTIAHMYFRDPNWDDNTPEDIDDFVSSIDPTKSDMLDITRALVMRGDYRTLQEIVDCELYQVHHLTISKCAFFFYYAMTHGEYPKSDTMALLKFEVFPELRSDMDLMNCYGHWLPVDISSKIVSDYYDCDFIEIKNELEPYYDVKNINELYDRRIQSTDPNDSQSSAQIANILVAFAHRPLDWATEADLRYTAPIEPLSTDDFLAIALKYDDNPHTVTGDDRAHWWSESNDVVFSPEFESWLTALASEHEALAAGGDLPATSEVLPMMMDILDRAHEALGYPVMFSSVFYDFLRRSEEPRVKAAIVQMNRILERSVAEKDGAKVERYCAVLSNEALRVKVLGF